jgi:predicted MPP superfamily phosphohydrolase
MHTQAMSRGLLLLITLVQTIIAIGHILVYLTATFAFLVPREHQWFWMGVTALLSVWFVVITVVSMRGYSRITSWCYIAAALWMGTLSLLVWASVLFWLIWNAALFVDVTLDARLVYGLLAASALMASAYGAIHALKTRIVRFQITLPNTPAPWRGRTIALVSDMHLGMVFGARALKRLASLLNREKPDLVCIAGDLFDGTPFAAEAIAKGLTELHAPLGVFFAEGNHEEFRDPSIYRNLMAQAGIRHLMNEWVAIEGVALAGVTYQDTRNEHATEHTLSQMNLPPHMPLILMKHVPNHRSVVAHAGVSLMLSGHTHHGQMIPYRYFAQRMFADATVGLWRTGAMVGVTSSGFGTWGPPQRIGTSSQLVLITLN